MHLTKELLRQLDKKLWPNDCNVILSPVVVADYLDTTLKCLCLIQHTRRMMSSNSHVTIKNGDLQARRKVYLMSSKAVVLRKYQWSTLNKCSFVSQYHPWEQSRCIATSLPQRDP